MTIQPEKVRKRRPAFVWNVLTILVLVATALLVYYYVTVFRDPMSAFNFFKPEATPTVYYTVTPTITLIQQPATWTATITTRPPSTRTRAPTWTGLPGAASATPTSTATFTLTPTLAESLTPSISVTPMPAVAEITYHPSTEVYPDKNCDWMGVGGTVLNSDGTPLQFQTVQLGGALGEVIVSQLKLSGSAPLFGTSGFEFELGSQPVASTQTLWIQLFDNTGNALTEKIYFDTYDDCARNLVKIIFIRNR
jgi:hypothetical protein